VNFARDHNLRLSVKSSGHDYLGRSTAKHSLLISTNKLRNISVSDDKQLVTIGSGATLNMIYPALKEQGLIMVGGTAATVHAAGGYVQGAGHSALSPLLGLAADNTLGKITSPMLTSPDSSPSIQCGHGRRKLHHSGRNPE
jgi:FAD/FMN-containing dehydrogenase